MAPSINARFDGLEEKLFGTEEIAPGVLVRMDRRLGELESNPMIHLGRFFRGTGRIAAVLLAVLGSAAYALSNLRPLVQTVSAFVNPHSH